MALCEAKNELRDYLVDFDLGGGSKTFDVILRVFDLTCGLIDSHHHHDEYDNKMSLEFKPVYDKFISPFTHTILNTFIKYNLLLN